MTPIASISNPSRFFRNTGAVAGVFVLVGLALASIILWIIFAVRRRRRTLRLEHEKAVSESLMAAGFRKSPLGDDDDEEAGKVPSGSGYEPVGARRSSSALAMSMASGAIRASAGEDFDPYTDYVAASGSRSSPQLLQSSVGSRPPSSWGINTHYRDHNSSDGFGGAGLHSHHSSASSEPLLSSHNANRRSGEPSPTLMAAVPPSVAAAYSSNTASGSGAGAGAGRDAGTRPGTATTILSLTSASGAAAGPSGVATTSAPTSSPKDPPPYTSDPAPATQTQSRPRSGILVNVADDDASVYSADSAMEERLDPHLRERSLSDLRDEEDYSRPVLAVCLFI